MVESEEQRAKRELREAVRRAVEGSEAGDPRKSVLHDSQARGGVEPAPDEQRS